MFYSKVVSIQMKDAENLCKVFKRIKKVFKPKEWQIIEWVSYLGVEHEYHQPFNQDNTKSNTDGEPEALIGYQHQIKTGWSTTMGKVLTTFQI